MDIPLAERLRPQSLDEFVGQEHLVGSGKPIRRMIENKKVISMVFWGPPGTGKTTLARIIAKYIEANFVSFSAVAGGGVAEVRKIIAEAKKNYGLFQKTTVLFVDEIHRFNKAQQDAFLPYVEDGTITLIGATTENPGFEVIAPLVSRSQIYILYALTEKEIETITKRAIKFFPKHKFEKEAVEHIIKNANGDGRTAINAVELSASLSKKITLKVSEEAVQRKAIFYDKKGDWHYDTISAFIKSMRGNNPDATLHYLAQTATYLATAKKSIASTDGIRQAMSDIDEKNLDPIPLHLRNASNKVMRSFGYGQGHIRYPWLVEKQNREKNLPAGRQVIQEYLPKNLKGKKYYKPDWK